MSMKLLLFLFIFALLAGTVSAAGINVARDAPSTARYGEQIRITISITNNLDRPIIAQVEEQVDPGDAIDPKPEIPTAEFNVIAVRPPYLSWSLSVGSGETKSVHYVIQPRTVGWYSLPRTTIRVNNAAFFINTSTIIITCNANRICEPEFGENARNCAADCPSGGADNLCNRARDGYCDPDCESGADLDCVVNSTGMPAKPSGSAASALHACLGGLVILVVIIALAYYFLIRKKKEVSASRPASPPAEPKKTLHKIKPAGKKK